jgi:RimJ/RimL family protein N-acetyltransferase
MQNPFIVGDRIYLRAVDVDDVDNFVTWLNDEEVRQYLSMTSPFNKTREKEFVDGLYKDDNNIILGIVLKENDNLVGNIGLHKISRTHRNAELGIFIGDKSCWSKGYGTEALKLVIKYGFNQLNLHRIYLDVFDFNTRAMRTYEKAGFKKEGIYREHYYRNGKYCDVFFMGILKSEWNDHE